MTLRVLHNSQLVFTADTLSVSGSDYRFNDNAPPPPPSGRLTSALVTWVTHDSFTQVVDLTQYKNVAGVISRGQVPVDWPYISGPLFKFQCPAGQYASFQINVPPTGMPTTTHMLKNPIYQNGASLKVSISHTPGDFNPATALKVVSNVVDDDRPAIWFRNGAPTGSFVGLTPGQTYYLNVVPMDNTRTQLIALATQ